MKGCTTCLDCGKSIEWVEEYIFIKKPRWWQIFKSNESIQPLCRRCFLKRVGNK